MTTPWQPAAQWRGASVAVLLSGPSMNAAVAQQLRERCDRVIAVKHTARLAPWADMLVALDAPWPDEFRAFAGMRVTGVADDTLDALYPGHFCERVLTDGGALEIRNSGLAAMRIAAAMGAARIEVAGFAPEAQRRWHDAPELPARGYLGVHAGMVQIVNELAASGVEVEFHGV